MDAINYVSETLFWIINLIVMTGIAIAGFFGRKYIADNATTLKDLKAEINENRSLAEANQTRILERTDKRFTETINEFKTISSSLKDAVNDLKSLVQVIKVQTEIKNTEIERRLSDHINTLADHTKELKAHGEKIKEIEVKCRYSHEK